MTVKNIPFNKPRNGVPAERLYLEYWQNYVKIEINDCGKMITNFDILYRGSLSVSKQRFAMVAASFITYMGCNMGMSFTTEAEDFYRRTDGLLTREDAFVAKWALVNKRVSGINHGSIPMESIVGRKVFSNRGNCGYGGWIDANVNKLTVEDFEIVNLMVRWWAGEDAKALREHCNPIASKMNKKIMDNLFNQNLNAVV